jgi:hypothetical protein
MIRRRGEEPQEDSSSSDEEDVFAALSKKTKWAKTDSGNQSSSHVKKPALPKPQHLPISLTSSMKRHHKPNDTRKAKMDALLQELEAEKDRISREPQRFVPEKKGSFVEPSEEHMTTNIFVGNLAPSITE